MKKPNIEKLKINMKETRRIRSSMVSQKSIKITINIDSVTLEKLKSAANKTGIPYQRLLNRTLQDGLSGKEAQEDRLEKLEIELNRIKRKLAA